MLATAGRETAEPMDDRIGECGAAAATRRTEPGNMVPAEDRIGFEGTRRSSVSAKEGMREKVTGHDAGVRVLARLIPMFGHRSKVEEGGWSHPDNLESLAPLKGLASCQAARLSATDKGQQFQKRVFAARAAAQGGWGGVAEKEQELISKNIITFSMCRCYHLI